MQIFKKGIVLVFIMFLFNTSSFSAELSQEDVKAIKDKVTRKGFSDAIVDLNLRISIPSIQGLSPVDLWATLIRHQGDKPLPTIIVATPYRRGISVAAFGLSLFPHGYNILAVDIRGTGSSSGTWISFGPEEHTDMAYVIDKWIPKHGWSDGKVGMIGASYLAIAQLLAAGQVECNKETGEPLHLKALFPVVSMSDAYKDIVMHGGNLNLAFIPLWLGGTQALGFLPSTLNIGGETPDLGFTEDDNNITKEIWRDWMGRIEQAQVNWSWFLDPVKILDGPFFDERSPMTYWPDKNPVDRKTFGSDKTISPKLPVFLTAGWYDIFTRGSCNNYQYMLKNHAETDKRLIIGPWTHIGGAIGLGVPALFQSSEVPARWFDWKIKGIKDPFMEAYPVMIYVMGKNKWRLEKSWALPESRVDKKSYYLSKKQPAVDSKDWFSFLNAANNFSLVEKTSPTDFKNDNPVLVHDPSELHGTRSKSSVRWTAGAYNIMSDFSKLVLGMDYDKKLAWEDERKDELGCLTFTTEPLDKDIEITGPLTLSFWAETKFGKPVENSKLYQFLSSVFASTGNPLHPDANNLKAVTEEKDVQWVVEINDVSSDGRAKNITSGWLRASHRPYDLEDDRNVDKNYIPFDPFYDGPDRQPKRIKEGERYHYVVEVWPTSNVFKKGHRIRVSISGSDYPHLMPIMVPSNNTLVINESHKAKLEFSSVNTKNENKTWKWVKEKNINNYLRK